MNEAGGRVTVSIQQIAQIAGVGRSAVGNWRKRHHDFPVPDSSGGFDLRQIERWLIENGKIDRPAPAGFMAWSLADSLRDSLSPDEITEFLVAALVYLEACDATPRWQDSRVATRVGHTDTWDQLRQPATGGTWSRAECSGSGQSRARIPALDNLLVPGFAHASTIRVDLLVPLIDSLEAAADESTTRLDLFEQVLRRAHGVDRFRGGHSTPRDVTRLMLQLAGDHGGTVCDLACGEGGLLASAALRSDRDVLPDNRFIGFRDQRHRPEDGSLPVPALGPRRGPATCRCLPSSARPAPQSRSRSPRSAAGSAQLGRCGRVYG